MILFELKCASDHRFEAWFRDGAAYDAQAAAGTIACPLCGDTQVGKAPMAPRIAKRRGEPAEPAKVVPAPEGGNEKAVALQSEVLQQLGELRRAVEENCDYVGDRFAEEARRIHYGETDPRGIYGEASAKDVAELKDEGVTIHRIPWLPRTNS
ncbi:DUF1178 family protein [Azospirillum sp. TSO22-1]|uniref:DUF1178 family protein n=1 Tax=Azospirillum sp. TSO22-1 TaxID=716789 RepID=UPI000D618166|nr:DUF1178 family protein [Azospirillum sp. TSO22-1]PWC53431.1 hypothetical protein TSO221_10935 [Azospirillum sp. TSO22-1]